MLCRESTLEAAERWSYYDASGNKHLLGTAESEGETLATFEVDHNWHYVAILTAEEGHPFLGIYDLDKWLASAKKPTPIYALNPYLGTIHIRGWRNNQWLYSPSYGEDGLHFSTNGPSTSKEAATGHWPLEKTRNFRFNPSTMQLINIPPSPVEAPFEN